MSAATALAQPILLDVDADGRLIRADAPILRIHLLAGGEDGGTLAIPSLAAMAAATHKFKMKLARTAIIGDGDENIEIWVESELNEKNARLKILSWHPRPEQFLPAKEEKKREQQIDAVSSRAALIFDRNLRLISIESNKDFNCGKAAIGASARDVFSGKDDGTAALIRAMEKNIQIRVEEIFIAGSSQACSISASPKFGKNGELLSYICMLEYQKSQQQSQPDAAPSPELFGIGLGTALRQPLGRIIANAETIGGKLQGPIRDSYAVYARDIADAARHLVSLVDDLGDLEAIEKPGFVTAKDKIELGDIARRVAGLLALKAADNHIKIDAPDENQKVAAEAEFRRVLQIVINLVTNAVRYSPGGTKISIGIKSDKDFAVMTVRDEGDGIPVDAHEKIFEKFERLGRSGDGGSGLGLYLSRRLARFMGGDLTVSNAEQGGAIFTLTLPKDE